MAKALGFGSIWSRERFRGGKEVNRGVSVNRSFRLGMDVNLFVVARARGEDLHISIVFYHLPRLPQQGLVFLEKINQACACSNADFVTFGDSLSRYVDYVVHPYAMGRLLG